MKTIRYVDTVCSFTELFTTAYYIDEAVKLIIKLITYNLYRPFY